MVARAKGHQDDLGRVRRDLPIRERWNPLLLRTRMPNLDAGVVDGSARWRRDGGRVGATTAQPRPGVPTVSTRRGRRRDVADHPTGGWKHDQHYRREFTGWHGGRLTATHWSTDCCGLHQHGRIATTPSGVRVCTCAARGGTPESTRKFRVKSKNDCASEEEDLMDPSRAPQAFRPSVPGAHGVTTRGVDSPGCSATGWRGPGRAGGEWTAARPLFDF